MPTQHNVATDERLTTKISGGRKPLHHNQDISIVRFIDLLAGWRYQPLTNS
ncbi:MAG: hypothetical protein V7K48_11885 [Nostoc sp.]|uniref:hypothetical protein n=1 Tax=Nostoc sp. TaxID=1180 RepID=UPI002FF74162